MVRRPLQHALDELRFGPTRTLNLRTSLPSGPEAAKRTEAWLRMKQAEGVREVLVITGRGNQSVGRVPVVRETVRRLLGLLSTRGVVIDHSEHSAGSFAVRLAPLGASPLHRPAPDAGSVAPPADPPTLDGLSDATRDQLRTLAVGTLHALGIRDPSPEFVRDEMARQCDRLAAATQHLGLTAIEREQHLRAAVGRALEALDDDQR
jgi:hypothetical protein